MFRHARAIFREYDKPHCIFKKKYSMEFSRLRNVQTASEAQHASYSMNTEAFLETKRPGREANHSPPTAELYDFTCTKRD